VAETRRNPRVFDNIGWGCVAYTTADPTIPRPPLCRIGFRRWPVLKEYGKSLAVDANLVRTALTNKLLEIADCGEIKYELKAIELLGKHSDIGLFTERSEININYNSPDALEKQIKERVKRLLNADIIDVTPLGMDLDEELGIAQLEYIEEEDVQEPVQEEDVQEPVQEEDEE
jgi:hypothetical protein